MSLKYKNIYLSVRNSISSRVNMTSVKRWKLVNEIKQLAAKHTPTDFNDVVVLLRDKYVSEFFHEKPQLFYDADTSVSVIDVMRWRICEQLEYDLRDYFFFSRHPIYTVYDIKRFKELNGDK